jgi:mannobiose 2-epimerase
MLGIEERDALGMELEQELVGNILPFWMAHAVDRVHGGFYGAVTDDLQVHNHVPRSAILCARILWTYARAYCRFGEASYLDMARWAYSALTEVFWDWEYGGVYWTVDVQGRPVMDRKHHYAQAFAIYGLCAYYQATEEPRSLALAQELFYLLEKHAYDPVHGGYIEGRSRRWQALDDMRLSDRDMDCSKSMNTMLHILEAYTQLLRVWEPARAPHRALIEAFMHHILDEKRSHFHLFFDGAWQSLLDHVSYGHDIEGSWLLVEAAEVQGDIDLLRQVRRVAVAMADAVYRAGIDADGSLFYEAGPHGLVDDHKSWWVQAEAMVGFTNAYQLSGEERFMRAALRCWAYIQSRLVDRVHGGWHKVLQRDGTPDPTSYKVGPWECPYHHSRACMEMLDRLSGRADERHPADRRHPADELYP